MLLDMLWLCASHFQILINKACTIWVTRSFRHSLTWETDANLFGWEKGCGSESSPGGQMAYWGQRSQALVAQAGPFSTLRK